MLSYWESKYYQTKFDTIIIGAGIVGLSAALFLHKKNPKSRILVLEQELIGTLASTKNAGFMCLGSPSELAADLVNHGQDAVYSNVKRRFNGLNLLTSLVSKKQIQYRNNGGAEVFDERTLSQFDLATTHLETLNHIFRDITKKENFYLLRDDLLSNFGLENGFQHLFKISVEASIDSQLLNHQLRKRVIDCGIQIMTGIKVSKIEGDLSSGYSIMSNFKADFLSRTVMVCNNAFASQIIQSAEVKPGRGLVLVSKPLKNMRLQGNFHYNEGFTYFRSVENRILIGGGRDIDFDSENTYTEGINPKIQAYLTDFLSTKFVDSSPIKPDYFWSGIMGFTASKKPIIEEVQKGLAVCAGMNGMGIAIGAACAKEGAELIQQSIR